MQNMLLPDPSIFARQGAHNIFNIRNLTVNFNCGCEDEDLALSMPNLLDLATTLPAIMGGITGNQPALAPFPQQAGFPQVTQGGFIPGPVLPQQPPITGAPNFLPGPLDFASPVAGSFPAPPSQVGFPTAMPFPPVQPARDNGIFASPLQQFNSAAMLMQQIQAQQAHQRQLAQATQANNQFLEVFMLYALFAILSTLRERASDSGSDKITLIGDDKPAQPAPPVNPGGTGSATGDPHFKGFEGDDYDVQGEAGKVYNILSDKTIQYNARFNLGAVVVRLLLEKWALNWAKTACSSPKMPRCLR